MLEDASAPHGGEIAYTTPDRLLRDFASRGVVVLAPEALGVAPAIHDVIYAKEQELFRDNRGTITTAAIPEVLQVLNAPGLVAACNQLVGEHWAIVPFTHNAPFASGAHDQHWHKDDNGPFNGRKQRHHQAVQVELLYYPQAVSPEMGPTAIVPYSQYWAFNHEENQDNFAGADHLDFGYHLGGMERVPVSGPKSSYNADDIAKQCTAHDLRMRRAITGTGWPLVRQFEVAPLRAGSVVLYSHNLFHRGNHRRDDWHTWRCRPRFMWRFWLYRTTEPGAAAGDEINWNALGIDPLTQHDLATAPSDATAVWRYHHHWLRSGTAPPRQAGDADALDQQLHSRHDATEPARIGAAYKLANLAQPGAAARLLGQALHSERETVRRAAAYGLAALGEDATPVLLDAVISPAKWVRKAAVFALGDAGAANDAVRDAIAIRLAEDESVYVRSVAAAALGCLGRRAVAAGVGATLVPGCLDALLASLGREENRLAMNIAQDRHIKIVRPTDECDVCEGIGINYGLAGFDPVRSAVRENALWSTVVLCSHGAAMAGGTLARLIDALADVVRNDRNLFSAGLALDALNRLARLHPADRSILAQRQLEALLDGMPALNWESLMRGGFEPTKDQLALA